MVNGFPIMLSRLISQEADLLIRSNLGFSSLLKGPGNRNSNLPITGRPALPPEPLLKCWTHWTGTDFYDKVCFLLKSLFISWVFLQRSSWIALTTEQQKYGYHTAAHSGFELVRNISSKVGKKNKKQLLSAHWAHLRLLSLTDRGLSLQNWSYDTRGDCKEKNHLPSPRLRQKTLIWLNLRADISIAVSLGSELVQLT